MDNGSLFGNVTTEATADGDIGNGSVLLKVAELGSLVLVGLVGVVGNTMVMLVIARDKKLHKFSYALMFNLR